MMFKLLKVLVLILMCMKIAHGGNETNFIPTFDLHEKTFRCHFANEAKETLKTLDKQVMKDFLMAGLLDIETALDQSLEIEEKKFLKEQRKLLKALLRMEDTKKEMDDFYTDLCLGTEKFLKTGLKGIANVSNVFSLGVGLPFRFIGRFFKGLKNGSDSEQTAMTSFDILGGRRSKSLAFFLLFKSYKIALGSNPWLAPFFLAPLVNTMVMGVCQNVDNLTPRDQLFCQHYLKTKQKVISAAAVGEKWGARLHPNKLIPVAQTWSGEVTEENFCAYLGHLANSKTSKKRSQETRELMVSNLNPGFMADPATKVLLTADSRLKKAHFKQMMNLRNVIVSLAPSDGVLFQIKSQGTWSRYQKIQKELSQRSKIFNKLYRLKNHHECLSLKAKKNFSFFEYQKLKTELSTLKQEAFLNQHLDVEKQIKTLREGSTKLKWELVSSHTLNTVRELLESRDVGNVIIITHSVGDYKKLMDSSFNQYPSTFFSRMSPQLMSLSFFTCHSENILKTYDLESKFINSDSFHQKKLLNFVKGNNVLDNHEAVPIKGFLDYFLKIDRKLDHVLHENLLAQTFMDRPFQTEESKLCTIELPGALPQSGSLSVILNRHFLGNLNRFEGVKSFRFPCDLLKNENTLLLQNSALVESLIMEEIPSHLIINGEDYHQMEWRNFFDQKAVYASSKVLFSW